LVSATFHIEREKVFDLPITEFNTLINQAVNIGGFWGTGHLQMQTESDKMDLLKAQYRELKKKGIL